MPLFVNSDLSLDLVEVKTGQSHSLTVAADQPVFSKIVQIRDLFNADDVAMVCNGEKIEEDTISGTLLVDGTVPTINVIIKSARSTGHLSNADVTAISRDGKPDPAPPPYTDHALSMNIDRPPSYADRVNLDMESFSAVGSDLAHSMSDTNCFRWIAAHLGAVCIMGTVSAWMWGFSYLLDQANLDGYLWVIIWTVSCVCGARKVRAMDPRTTTVLVSIAIGTACGWYATNALGTWATYAHGARYELVPALASPGQYADAVNIQFEPGTVVDDRWFERIQIQDSVVWCIAPIVPEYDSTRTDVTGLEISFFGAESDCCDSDTHWCKWSVDDLLDPYIPEAAPYRVDANDYRDIRTEIDSQYVENGAMVSDEALLLAWAFDTSPDPYWTYFMVFAVYIPAGGLVSVGVAAALLALFLGILYGMLALCQICS